MSDHVRWSHLQDDDLDGDTYYDMLVNFNADKAEYCRAVDIEGCSCTPHPSLSRCNLLNRWCRGAVQARHGYRCESECRTGALGCGTRRKRVHGGHKPYL